MSTASTSPSRRIRRRMAALAVALPATVAGLAGVAAPAHATTAPVDAGSNVVISQLYGAGGNVGGLLAHDFIELFNRGIEPVSVAGWSVQYAAGIGANNFGSATTTRTALPAVTLAPGQYLLVKGGNGSTANPNALPTPVVDGAINLHENNGKVALVRSTEPLGCGGSTVCTSTHLAKVADLVGYGVVDLAEGTAATGMTPTRGVARLGGGCTDTNNNGHDFVAASPAPRTADTPFAPCPAALEAAAAKAAAEQARLDAEREALEAEQRAVEEAARQAEAEQAAAAAEELRRIQEELDRVAAEQAAAEQAAKDAAAAEQAAKDAAAKEAAEAAAKRDAECKVLQPINCDGTSVFKLGSTVPVKFLLPGTTAGAFTFSNTSSSQVGSFHESVSTLTPSSGAAFRLDGTSGQQHFNWSTKGQTAGTYQLVITLANGVQHTASVTLR